MVNQPFNNRLKQLNTRYKTTDIKAQLDLLFNNQPAKIEALQAVHYQIKGTNLDGLPFRVALLKSNLLSDKEIANDLEITLSEVRKITRMGGFNSLVAQMQPAVWSDLQLAAQATIMHHLTVNQDKDLAVWLLESTGQVASSRPLTVHQHKNQTLVLNGQQQNQLPQLEGGGPVQTTVETLANEIFQRMASNAQQSGPPPKTISQD